MKIRLLCIWTLAVAVALVPCSAVQARPTYTYSEHAYTDQPSNTGSLFFIGAAALAVAGFFVWLFSSPSDEAVLAHAKEVLDTADTRHGHLADYLATAYPGGKHTMTKEVDETILEELAQKYSVRSGAYMSLQDACKKLEKEHAVLEKRMKHIVGNADKVGLYEDMDALSLAMGTVLGKLQNARYYIKEHDDYFRIRDTFFALSDTYKNVYTAAQQYQGAQLREKMHGIVMQYGQRHDDCYPYVAYVDTLSTTLASMHENVSRRYYAHDYPALLHDAHEVMQVLERAKDALLMGDTYTKQKIEKERARREEERLALERRTAQALEKQAAAQALQAEANMLSAAAHLAHAGHDSRHHCTCAHHHGAHCSCGYRG